MRFRKLMPAAAGIAVLALSLSACGGGSTPAATTSSTSTAASSSAPAVSSSGTPKLMADAKAGKLKIGIKIDQPGLGLKAADGTYSGFDVDVAKYVAKELGVEATGIEFVQAKSAEREDLISTGQVDMIVATYSITDKRKEVVDFAGPYFVAHQDLLVASANTDITGPDATSGKLLCSVSGSTSAQTFATKYPGVNLQNYGSYSECVDALLSGSIDVVTTDDVILAGYAAQHPGELKVVGKGFSNENYGIGLMKGDTEGKTAVNAAITKMISDGSWKKSLEANVGPSGYTIPTPPTLS
jgi:glutamate transport system substrate-binding protein